MTMALLVGVPSQTSISMLFQHRPTSTTTTLSFKYKQPQPLTKSLVFQHTRFSLKFKCNGALAPVNVMGESNSDSDILRGSTRTRTVTTLMGLALLLMRKAVLSVSSNSVSTMGALFFASLRDRPSGALNTPLTVVAAGLGKWLDIYSGVLMVRVLLSWFPNIPWERQPLSAIRDLCDPYLNLFRNIIPPIFDTLDVSPLLAFAVLGTLGSILQTAM